MQYHKYKDLEAFSNLEVKQHIERTIRERCTDASKLYEDLDMHLEMPMPDTEEMLGSDVLIPCLIYAYTKALTPEILALLGVINNFTLQKYADEFSFVEKTMQGLDMFIRNEMHKLDQKTERFTYRSNRLTQKNSMLLTA